MKEIDKAILRSHPKLKMSEREAMIIRLRFGLEDGRCRTLEEIAKVYGITRERIRQLEGKALKKLRIALELINPNYRQMYKDIFSDI